MGRCQLGLELEAIAFIHSCGKHGTRNPWSLVFHWPWAPSADVFVSPFAHFHSSENNLSIAITMIFRFAVHRFEPHPPHPQPQPPPELLPMNEGKEGKKPPTAKSF